MWTANLVVCPIVLHVLIDTIFHTTVIYRRRGWMDRWMGAVCQEMRDRARAETYCLLGNYSLRRSSQQQQPSLDREPLIRRPEGHQGGWLSEDDTGWGHTKGNNRAVDKNIMEESAKSQGSTLTGTKLASPPFFFSSIYLLCPNEQP